jgi:hypothetical protein
MHAAYDHIDINDSPLSLDAGQDDTELHSIEVKPEYFTDRWVSSQQLHHKLAMLNDLRRGHVPVRLLQYIGRIFYRDGSMVDLRFGYEGVEVH